MQALHPNQFQVNEAWIAFKLNSVPITTKADGDFDVMALMDAASCFILESEFVQAGARELSREGAKRLLEGGQSHMQQLPKTLFIPMGQPADSLSMEAESQGITVTRVPDAELSMFIGEARTGFRERFGGSDVH